MAPDMGNQKNNVSISSPVMRGSVAGNTKTSQVKTLQASMTDFEGIQYIGNRRKKMVGRKPYAKKWTRNHNKITFSLTKADRLRYKTNWNFALNSSGKNSGPLASRPESLAAVSLKDHLYRESEHYQSPIPPQDRDRLPKDDKVSETYRKGPRVDKTLGWECWPSSSSSSTWWRSD